MAALFALPLWSLHTNSKIMRLPHQDAANGCGWKHLIGDVEAEGEDWGAVGDPAAGDQVDARGGDGRGGFAGDAAKARLVSAEISPNFGDGLKDQAAAWG
jgi:hypothetical protein